MGKKVLILLAALLSAFCLDAQIVDFGLGAGYSLANEALHMKGASTSILMGPNHGFYLEPQVDFNIGKGFSVRTGLQFRKGGSDLFLDLEKLSVNLNQIALDLQDGNRELVEYLREHPEMVNKDLTADKVEEYVNDYEKYTAETLETLKNTDITLNVDRYALTLPIVIRYTTGRLSVHAGVNLNCMVIDKVDFLAHMPGGTVYSGKDAAGYLPYLHYALTRMPPASENAVMGINKFYRLDFAHEFTVGLQAGVDFAVTDWMSLKFNYIHGLSSEIKHPWTDLFTLYERAWQFGLVYHFHFKNKKKNDAPVPDL